MTNVTSEWLLNLKLKCSCCQTERSSSCRKRDKKCIYRYLKTYFNVDKWSINQPIILKDLYVELSKIQGVQSVKNMGLQKKWMTPSFILVIVMMMIMKKY